MSEELAFFHRRFAVFFFDFIEHAVDLSRDSTSICSRRRDLPSNSLQELFVLDGLVRRSIGETRNETIDEHRQGFDLLVQS